MTLLWWEYWAGWGGGAHGVLRVRRRSASSSADLTWVESSISKKGDIGALPPIHPLESRMVCISDVHAGYLPIYV